MAVVAASASSPYDEMVVPALRKRLEAESQVITKRMSGHTSFGEGLPDDAAPLTSSQPSSSTVRQRVASPELYSKPSSIPRPNLQTVYSYANSSRDALALSPTPAASAQRGTKSDRLPSTSVMKSTGGSARQQQDASLPPTQTSSSRRVRSRTTSTPYPYEELTAAPIPDLPSALPTPASSRANSPLATNTSALSRPSGIPVPRSVSNSRSGLPAPKTPRSRSRTGDDRHRGGGAGAEDDFLHPMRYPPSPEPSPELAYAAVANGEPISLRMIQPPFPLTGSVTGGGASDSETGRSSFERDPDRYPGSSRAVPKEYEFWYRGDKARNGGRGEVHRVGTAEMLEIAAFGHRLREERKGMDTQGSMRQREVDGRGAGAGKRSVPLPKSGMGQAEWGDEPAYGGDGMELEEDSVMRERPLSWVVDAEGSVTDLVLESLGREKYRTSAMLLQQADDVVPEHEQQQYEEPFEMEPMRYEPVRYDSSLSPPSGARELSKSAPVGLRPAAMSKSATTAKLNGNARATRIPAAAAAPNGTAASRQRVPSRPQKPGPSNSNGSTSLPKPSNPTPRSVSQPTHLNRDSTASMSLVDAIPDVPSRKAEKMGNWDEVVLPTVARRLGLDGENEEQEDGWTGGVDEFGERNEERIPPAPGTFGYDASKYRPPSDYAPPGGVPPPGPLSSSAQFSPPRVGSPAPFASYTPVPPTPPVRPEPVLSKSSTAFEREKAQKGRKPPKIVVSGPPPPVGQQDMQDDKHGNGCKCVIM